MRACAYVRASVRLVWVCVLALLTICMQASVRKGNMTIPCFKQYMSMGKINIDKMENITMHNSCFIILYIKIKKTLSYTLHKDGIFFFC